MALVIGISGKRGVGKSLLCNPYLKARGFEIFAFADPLKEDVRRAYGITKEHTDGKLKEVAAPKLGGRTPREAMIAEGEVRRRFSENGLYWVSRLYDKIKTLHPDTLVAISDVRFKNEATYIRHFGGYIVRLERDPKLSIYKGAIDDPSETELDDYNFDKILPAKLNVTPQDLERFAEELKSWTVDLSKLVK